MKKWGRKEGLSFRHEEHNSVILRCNALFDEIIKKYRNEKVLIISHDAFIKKILKELVPDLNEKTLQNTPLTSLILLENT
ncbi:histidine phosphatase family protein [Metabacillus endolithicus]|uniref:Histidine phosphatase family protein n=1 Tax=Metabacillus endolithicus TaxID=1535204 RepID=A0ABW5BUN7_9BACI